MQYKLSIQDIYHRIVNIMRDKEIARWQGILPF